MRKASKYNGVTRLARALAIWVVLIGAWHVLDPMGGSKEAVDGAVSVRIQALHVLPRTDPEQPVLKGTVIRVVDGDTLSVFTGSQVVRVDLAHIDAPELEQMGGYDAYSRLRILIYDEAVKVRVVNTDSRPIQGLVYRAPMQPTPNGRAWSVNLQMIREGSAWAARQEEESTAYGLLEAYARSAAAGLWAAPFSAEPVEPWRYRVASDESPLRTFSTELFREKDHPGAVYNMQIGVAREAYLKR